MEALFNGAVELTNLRLRIACRLRVDVHDVSVHRIEFQVNMLEFVQAFRKQSGSNQQTSDNPA